MATGFYMTPSRSQKGAAGESRETQMGSADDGGGIPLFRRSLSDRLLPDSPDTDDGIIRARDYYRFSTSSVPRGDGSPGRHLTSRGDWKMDRIPMRK
ncbi:hypothetical protein TNCV_3008231 [Trichonephila clavipes]|nr:hypothetical protein TNCV_3008231 [Trichonephila clavipes]